MHASLTAGITVVAVHHPATDDHAKDATEDCTDTAAVACSRTSARSFLSAGTRTGIRIHRRRSRHRGGTRIRSLLDRRRRCGSRSLSNLRLRLVDVLGHHRRRCCVHRRVLRGHCLGTRRPPKRMRGSRRALRRDFGERERRRLLVRSQVESVAGHLIEICLEVGAHCRGRWRGVSPATREHNGRQRDRNHRCSQERPHSCLQAGSHAGHGRWDLGCLSSASRASH